jgi:hypothetical protein
MDRRISAADIARRVLCAAGLVVTTLAATVPVAAQSDAVTSAPAQDAGDERRFMHGIGQANAGNGKTWVFFSSSGLPPRGANPDGSWPHDVYVGEWQPGASQLSRVRTFIKRPEAQEPVSVAQNASGNILVTFEDGWNAPRTISQRYGVYRRDLSPIKPYPQTVESGGHSGHAAAVGAQFVVAYSTEWVEGGGFDDRGTGDGVYVRIYDGRGRMLRHVEVAAHARQDWPVVAGSPRRALLVWQRYPAGGTSALLEYALLDPDKGKLTRLSEAEPLHVQHYAYAAAFVPDLERFMVVATRDDGEAVAFLIDEAGRKTATLGCLPAIVRESSIVVAGLDAYLPTQDGRLARLALRADRMTLHGLQRAPFAWGNTGITGIASGTGELHYVSLSAHGLRETDFDTREENATAPADRPVANDTGQCR